MSSYICDENDDVEKNIEEEQVEITENERKSNTTSSSDDDDLNVGQAHKDEFENFISGQKVCDNTKNDMDPEIISTKQINNNHDDDENDSNSRNNPLEFNISSTSNPLKIPLKSVLNKSQKKVFFQLLDIVMSVSTITVSEHEFMNSSKTTPSNDDEWKEHRLNLVQHLKSNAYDFVYVNVPSKISRYEIISENTLNISNLIVLTPKVVSESKVSCPEGKFTNHKIIYEGRRPYDKEVFIVNENQEFIEIKFEYYDRSLVEITKPYNIKFILY